MSLPQIRRASARRHALLALFLLGSFTLITIQQRGLHTSAQAAGTLVVTNVNDSGPGSLRQAITDANNNAGPDTITFSIGSGPITIQPLQRLPVITESVVIDGTTQPGFSGTPIVELDGSFQADGNGLSIVGGDSTVRGLVINRFHFDGIAMNAKGGNRVEGCYIGTDITGTLAQPNGSNGISIPTSNNVIGGTTPALRNVISGNIGVGIDVSRFCCTGDQSPIVNNVIQGNYIGVNAQGTAAIPNRREGVRISSVNSNVPVTGNLVGGTQPGAGNVISGNGYDGLNLDGFHVKNNTVQGNFIGTDVTGSYALSNIGNGVTVTGSDNLIGGSTSGARNVISGNGQNGSGSSGGSGVGLGTQSGNVVQGNIIGANAKLTGPIPNLLHGVALGGTNSVIGGTAAGEGNVIAFNGVDGIVDASQVSVGNSFRGNSIFSNGYFNQPSGASIGIDLGGFGVTPNDAGDGDTGANNLQNFPVITSVTAGANSVQVKGTLNSTASTQFAVDFYANNACDESGFGEGARYIGSGNLSTDSSGNANFDLTFSVSLAANQVLTATATDPAGNTSEFSQCAPTSPAVGSVAFATQYVEVNESSGVASLILNRVGGSAGALTVGYAVTGETAAAGLDFVATQGTLTFADNETSKTINIPIIDDNIDEPFSETATVTLSASRDLDTLGSASTMILTITDNEPLPAVSVGDVSLAEGDAGTKVFNFPVTLSGPSSRAINISFETTEGTATAGTDYLLPVASSITIPAGQTSAQIAIQVPGDTNIEPDETFFVKITGTVGASIGDGEGKATILNDEPSSGPSLQLILEESGPTPDLVAALDSVVFLRDPFPVVNAENLLRSAADPNTRVTVFLTNLQLAPEQPPSVVIVNMVDANNQTYDLPAEGVRLISDLGVTQVTFRLPDNLTNGECTIKVKFNGQTSNAGTIRIKP